jgi:hypothetical protein
LLRCFSDDQVGQALQKVFDSWYSFREEFKEVEDYFRGKEGTYQGGVDLVNRLLDINKQFLILCTRRYAQALEELPSVVKRLGIK